MMSAKPLVSVIIPAYNRVDYIVETVDSVLDQSYDNVELIVVDDGSSDGTWEKLKEYGERITLLTHPERMNKGQSAAINLGLASAAGEYIAVLDSDDYWALDKLEKQVACLEDNPDYGLVYSNGYAVDSEGHTLYEIYDEDHEENNSPDRVLLDCYILLPQNSLVRRSVYDKAGNFNEDFRAAQDHDMLIRIAENTRFIYITDHLFYYRRHGNSISSTGQRTRWTNGFRILEDASARYPYKSSTIRKRKAVLNYRMGLCCNAEGRSVRAVIHMLKAFLLDPVRAVRVITGIDRIYR